MNLRYFLKSNVSERFYKKFGSKESPAFAFKCAIADSGASLHPLPNRWSMADPAIARPSQARTTPLQPSTPAPGPSPSFIFNMWASIQGANKSIGSAYLLRTPIFSKFLNSVDLDTVKAVLSLQSPELIQPCWRWPARGHPGSIPNPPSSRCELPVLLRSLTPLASSHSRSYRQMGNSWDSLVGGIPR